MIWKTDTHKFTATFCQRTGNTCPALARMARALTNAVASAGQVTTQDFEVEGSNTLAHCSLGCTARFRARPDQIRIFCGVEAEADIDKLDDYANLMFDSEHRVMSAKALSSPPCAMLEVLALSPATVETKADRMPLGHR